MLLTQVDLSKALRFGFFVAALTSPWFVDQIRSGRYIKLPKSGLRGPVLLALTAIFTVLVGFLFVCVGASLNGLSAGLSTR